MKVTFVLPAGGRSGGVRVTVEMANQLLARGHETRIAYYRAPVRSMRTATRRLISSVERAILGERADWLPTFRGLCQAYSDLRDLPFAEGEIAVAVGTHCIPHVHQLPHHVRKVRYCHGFSDYLQELTEKAWKLPMATISVSPLLIPRLKLEYGIEVVGVVPNGISPKEYFPEPVARDGIGLVFNDNPKKAPAETLELIAAFSRELPDVPCYVFSHNRWREGLPRKTFWRLPSVPQTRGIYNRCKVWLVASQSEGFCLPILEAMACGCAVVSSDHDTAPGLIEHGKNGFIVPFGNAPAFIAQTKTLLADEAERNRITQEGFTTAAGFTWTRAADAMEATLGRLSAAS